MERIYIGRVDPSPFHLHRVAHVARLVHKQYQNVDIIDRDDWEEFSQYEPMGDKTFEWHKANLRETWEVMARQYHE
jgi:hypothetical protein